MKRTFWLILMLLAGPLVGTAEAQGPTLQWSIATSLSNAQSYQYHGYFDGSTTPVLLGHACQAAASGGGAVCSAPYPNPVDGTHTVQITASKTIGNTTKVSPKSSLFTVDIVTEPPPPTGIACTGCAPLPPPVAVECLEETVPPDSPCTTADPWAGAGVCFRGGWWSPATVIPVAWRS